MFDIIFTLYNDIVIVCTTLNRFVCVCLLSQSTHKQQRQLIWSQSDVFTWYAAGRSHAHVYYIKLLLFTCFCWCCHLLELYAQERSTLRSPPYLLIYLFTHKTRRKIYFVRNSTKIWTQRVSLFTDVTSDIYTERVCGFMYYQLFVPVACLALNYSWINIWKESS